jgi:putative FmdB family regulatory protein
MPIYEYRCNACGHEFEEWQKMSDAPVRTCPKCKARKVEKMISQSSFQLKGSGWYATDYGRKNAGEAGKKKGAAKDKDGKDSKDGKGEKDKTAPSETADAKSGSSTDSGGGGSGGGEPKSASTHGASVCARAA